MSRRYNAYKHGAFTQIRVLPWEDQNTFDAMHQAFRDELKPNGITEESIVLEIAFVHLQKQRLIYSESAAVHKESPSPELIEAAKHGPSAHAEFARNQKTAPGGFFMTASEAIDFVKNKMTRADIADRTPSVPPPPTAVERAYDPELNMKYARTYAMLEARTAKLYQRLAIAKAFKKIHGLDCDLTAEATSTQEVPDSEVKLLPDQTGGQTEPRPSGWTFKSTRSKNRE